MNYGAIENSATIVANYPDFQGQSLSFLKARVFLWKNINIGHGVPYMAKALFKYKETSENGDILEIRAYEVPKSGKLPEGVSYSLVFVRNNERLVGYDNFEGHTLEGSSHHKHIGGRALPYEFVDIWKAIEDFLMDVDKRRNLR